MNHLEDEALRQSFPSFSEPLDALDDTNMFALLDSLDLDGGIPLQSAAERDMLATHPAGVPAPQQPSTSKCNDTARMEKIRARNREAAARYRQKAKVCCAFSFQLHLHI